MTRVEQHNSHHPVHKCIIVHDQPLSTGAKRELKMAENVEFFDETQLLFNVKQHVLVPTVTRLTLEEKQAVLKKYKVTDSQLPAIAKSDPVARFLGLERGQVIRIDRVSETAGEYTMYRVCV